MFHLDNNSGISSMPAPAATQSSATRWFTEGDGNKTPSWPGQDWFNIVQAELLSVLTDAGLAPDKAQFNQLSLAIKSIINTNALQKDNNLSDVSDVAEACENLGLKSAAFVDAQKSSDDSVPGKALISGFATAEHVGAVPAAGGDVDHLQNARFYAVAAEGWQGAGSFDTQLTDGTAPFYKKHGLEAPLNTYFPIIKGRLSVAGHGYALAASLGLRTTGEGSRFPGVCIHTINDSGESNVWQFDPNDGAFSTQGNIAAGMNVVATQGVYESSGGVRVYSPNNPPPGIRGVALGAEGFFDQQGGATTWTFRTPSGCMLTGMIARSTGSNSAHNIGGLYYKPILVSFDGLNWVQIAG